MHIKVFTEINVYIAINAFQKVRIQYNQHTHDQHTTVNTAKHMKYFYWTRLSEFTEAELGKIFSDEVDFINCCNKRQEVGAKAQYSEERWALETSLCVLQGMGHSTMPDLPTEDVSPRGTT